MINSTEVVIVTVNGIAIRSQRISTAGQDAFVTGCTVTGSQLQEAQSVKVFHEFLLRDNPCSGSTGKPSPLVVVGKYGRAVVTERNAQYIAVLEGIVQTAEERELVAPGLPRAQIASFKVGRRADVVILVHIRRKVVAHHVVRLGSGDVVSRTHHCIQVMILGDVLVESQVFFYSVVVVERIGETTVVLFYLCRQLSLR